jgi:hypothetical protein
MTSGSYPPINSGARRDLDSQNFVCHAHGRDVEVEGNVLVEDGKITTVDRYEVIDAASGATAAAWTASRLSTAGQLRQPEALLSSRKKAVPYPVILSSAWPRSTAA